MQIRLLKRKVVEGVLSGSGLEVINNTIYIAGDDAPHLYVLNKEWSLIRKVPVVEKSNINTDERIPKALKPDFEALTHLVYKKKDYLLLLGSGSLSPQRDTGYLISLPEEKVVAINARIDLLYSFIRTNYHIGLDLNIEAAASSADKMYFLQRGNVKGVNIIIEMDLIELMHFLFNETEGLPKVKFYNFLLPEKEGVNAGFSGAFVLEDKSLLFSCSLEATTNTIDDGEIMGSLLGSIPLPLLPDSKTKIQFAAIENKGSETLIKGKVESISLYKKNSHNSFEIMAVTDNDKGQSEVLLLELIL